MALKYIGAVDPCYTYAYPYVPGPYDYHTELVTAPRIYPETFTTGTGACRHFFYEPVNDYFVGYFSFTKVAFPCWELKRIYWDAGTGEVLEATNLGNPGLAAYTAQSSEMCNGKMYCSTTYLTIEHRNWQTMQKVTGGLDMRYYSGVGKVLQHVIVDESKKIFVGEFFSELLKVNYETWERLGTLALPEHEFRLDLAYEDEDLLWYIWQNTGTVAKINYTKMRYELLSSVEAPDPTDEAYLAAYDQSRKRLAIFRHRPDATDGACRCRIEFYSPVPQSYVLTAPVPVSSLKTNDPVTFVSSLVGDRGEGIAGVTVNASVDTEVAQLTTSVGFTNTCGTVAFELTAEQADSGTLELTAEV